MKVFISWSGDMSKELGEALRTWIPAVIQQVKPYFTPNDIEKGTRWSTDIASELNESKVGIICLTKQNLEKPWIMFEAGALSKQLDSSYVCPILFDLDSSDVTGPLVQFQSTQFSRAEIKKLVVTINKRLGESRLEDSVLDSVFEMWWPRLEEQVKKIIAKHSEKGESRESPRDQREILEEILSLTRMSVRRARIPKRNLQEIDPDAFIYLARRFVELDQVAKSESTNIEILVGLRKMKGVIEYLARRGAFGTEEYDEVMSLLESIESDFDEPE